MAKIIVPTANTTITSAWGKSVADTLNASHILAVKAQALTTNATGDITVTFPVAFADANVTVLVGNSTPGTMIVWSLNTATITATGFQARAFFSAGSTVNNGGVTISYIAIGTRL